MIVVIDFEDKIIEVDGVDNAKEAKKIIRETLKNFDDFEYLVSPPVEIKFIQLSEDFTLDDFKQQFLPLSVNRKDNLDIKPGPPSK
jgi:hypothetical protein